MSLQYCACCYGKKSWCRRCKTRHCECSWNQCLRKPAAAEEIYRLRLVAAAAKRAESVLGKLIDINEVQIVSTALSADFVSENLTQLTAALRSLDELAPRT